jgi:hypothetical protein
MRSKGNRESGMSTGTDETVPIDKREGYAIVTLNDPDRRNVFTLAMTARVRWHERAAGV